MSLDGKMFLLGLALGIIWTVFCILTRKGWNWKLFFKILLGWIVSAAIALILGFLIVIFGAIGWWGLLVIAIIIGIFTPTVYHVKIHK